MTVHAYLPLLDWTGRERHGGKRSRIPSECRPIPERLQLNGGMGLDLVEHFRRQFRSEAGRDTSRTEFRHRFFVTSGLHARRSEPRLGLSTSGMTIRWPIAAFVACGSSPAHV